MKEAFSQEDEQRRMFMETIFQAHFAAVHSYIAHKVKQPDVADDLTSQVFLKAFRWLLEDRGVGPVRSWLYATARTTIADYRQEQQKSLFLPLEEIENSALVQPMPQDDEQRQARVYHLLHLLPNRDRKILLLLYFQGYSAAEVGQQLGLPAGHVRVLHLRALRRAALLEAKERNHSLMKEAKHRPVTICTEQGQLVLALAKEEAFSFNHSFIGTEHLLLGILREGSAAALLVAQGATLDRLRAELLYMLGRGEPGSWADASLTPRSQRILEMAGEIAEQRGETAISPKRILQGIIREKQGIAIHMLQSLEVDLVYWLDTEEKPSSAESAQYIRQQEQCRAQGPHLSEEEERQLAYLVARSQMEQRRAKLLRKLPDSRLVKEGDKAFLQLLTACQDLVLSIAKEYFTPERYPREIMNAGNAGLSLAASTFGSKKQTSFRTYAAHMIHLQIIEELG